MKAEELTDKAIDYMLAELSTDLLAGHSKLTEWEGDFLISINDQWEHHRSLSAKQKEVLGNIWDKY
jgi:hypothetical protein